METKKDKHLDRTRGSREIDHVIGHTNEVGNHLE